MTMVNTGRQVGTGKVQSCGSTIHGDGHGKHSMYNSEGSNSEQSNTRTASPLVLCRQQHRLVLLRCLVPAEILLHAS